MITSFTFTNPDGSIQVLDIQSMFPPGCNSSDILAYGISLAKQYDGVCHRIASSANEIHHKQVNPAEDIYSVEDCVERIGIKLGQEIYRHMRHDESAADIWQDVIDRVAYRASGGQKTHIYIIDRGN